MTKDRICGMTVDEATALKAERDGQTFYFCSEHCRKKFLAEIQPAPATAKHEESRRAKSFIPARCTRKFNKIIREIVQSAA